MRKDIVIGDDVVAFFESEDSAPGLSVVPRDFELMARLDERSGPCPDSMEAMAGWALGHCPGEGQNDEDPRPLYKLFR